jgi:hypothetical protein
MLIARAGKDNEFINRSIETFVAAAVAAGVEIDYLNHAEGEHAFDVRNDDARSSAIIQRTLDFLVNALVSDPA